MQICVIIPARGGSKGIPGKNLRTVAGLSLVGLAIDAGRRALRRLGVDDVVHVDTDDAEIASECARWGAAPAFLRPPELARDETPTLENVLHAVARIEAHAGAIERVVLLQPTSPLREVDDVLAVVRASEESGSAIAVSRLPHPTSIALSRGPDGRLDWLSRPPAELRRQASEQAFWPTGSVYVSRLDMLRAERAFIVPGRTVGVEIPSSRAVDIDTPEDLELADALRRARAARPIHIGARAVGAGAPCFVIAEAGVNHGGDIALAHRLVDVAKEAGADAVKFQTFDPKKLASSHAQMAAYQEANIGARESQRDMLEKLTLPRDAHAELKRHAEDAGMMFLSTPFDEGSADFLEELGVPAFKIPSGEITNLPFLAHVARKGRPVLMSSGMADAVELARALDTLDAHGAREIALFQCVTSYPAAASDSNLRAIRTLEAAFGAPVGLSDHTMGIHVSIAAIAAGATLIEKHFTTDRSLPGPDHLASLEPGELKEMIRGIREVESALGDGIKQPRPVELPLRSPARKSLHATRDLPAGHVLTRADLVALRPGDGISPAETDRVVGQKLRTPLRGGQMLDEQCIDG